MLSMNKRVFRTVTGLHLALLVVLMTWGFASRWLTPKPTLTIPVEFIVDVTSLMPDAGIADDAPPAPEPAPEPEPELVPEPEPDPIPELVPEPPKPEPPKPEPPNPEPPKPPKPPIEISRTRVTRTVGDAARKPNPLSEAEIRRLLALGATAGDRTSIPDEDSRGLALIKTTLDKLWQKPSKAAAGDAESFLRLWIEPDGSVGKAELSRRSGNAELDASVEAVGLQVRRIHGLTSDFIQRRSPVTVSFTVQ
jgi:outer membrane biosynthesis protein TonB